MRGRLFIVGLGNYNLPQTRHSIGQVVLSSLFELAKAQRGSLSTPRTLALHPSKTAWYSTLLIPHPLIPSNTLEIHFILLKTLMNISGPLLSEFLSSLSLSPPFRTRELIAICDELDYPPLSTPRLVLGKSARGHHGVKSLENSRGIGGKDFWRIRIGIGRPSSKEGRVSDHVLEPLSRSEMEACSLKEDGEPALVLKGVWEKVLEVSRENERYFSEKSTHERGEVNSTRKRFEIT